MELPVIRKYQLAQVGDRYGVSCDERGAFVGLVPLLTKAWSGGGREAWTPRHESELNRSLSASYGLPIDVSVRRGGLAAIANALNRGDLVIAKIATVQLGLPDLPTHDIGTGQLADVVVSLYSSGLLKASPDDLNHPGWPAGTSGSRGGQFRPRNSDESGGEPLLPVADFSGGFHDAVVDAWMGLFQKEGIPAVRAPAIRIIGSNPNVIGYPDMMVHQAGYPLEIWEVKTGGDPPFTDNQRIYLPVSQIGGHIYSTDEKIRALGLVPGVPFPPVDVYVIYAPAPGEQYKIFKLPPPTIVP